MLRHYDYYGYLPIWHLWGQDNYCMIGNHAIPVIVDAVLKGIPGIDRKHAWEAVKNSSLQSHPNSPFDIWEEYGYMPENIQTQSVSISLEIAFDDWCAAQLAKAMGDDALATRFEKRSQFYRNLHNGEFFAPKDDNGQWIEPFDPLKFGANGGNPYTEGNAWQYYWYVPHDIDGLISLTGGKKNSPTGLINSSHSLTRRVRKTPISQALLDNTPTETSRVITWLTFTTMPDNTIKPAS